MSPGMNRPMVYSNSPRSCLGSATFSILISKHCAVFSQSTTNIQLFFLHIYLCGFLNIQALRVFLSWPLYWTQRSGRTTIHKSFKLLPSCDKGTTCIPSLRKLYPVLVSSGSRYHILVGNTMLLPLLQPELKCSTNKLVTKHTLREQGYKTSLYFNVK